MYRVCVLQHQYGSALFWASHLASLTESTCLSSSPPAGDTTASSAEASATVHEDRLLMAETLLLDGQFHRAARMLKGWRLDRASLRACHLCAMALMKAREYEEALEVLDNGAELLEAMQKELAEQEDEEEKTKPRQVPYYQISLIS